MENINIQTFLALVRAGLWEDVNLDLNLNDNLNGKVDWKKVYQLATEQSVLGLVLAGIDKTNTNCADILNRQPQELLLQWIGEVQMLEQQNKAMNQFIAKLIEKMRKADIYTLLVKGQGVAQCYDKPYWRASGDVDLILDEDNYQRGKLVLSKMATLEHEENPFDKHYSAEVDGFVVELHGTMRGMLTKKADDFMDELQVELFKNNRSREWDNDGTVVKLPCPDDDLLFVFTHILKHFFHYGIGLRQVCDWCRLLYTYRDSLNYELLESRLRKMAQMSEWKVFGALAVEYLGYPKDLMPFLETSKVQEFKKFKRKADRVLAFILETGNFGHNRDNSYYNNTNAIVRGMMSLWRHTCDSFKHSFIFPVDSVRIWCRMFCLGVKDALSRG